MVNAAKCHLFKDCVLNYRHVLFFEAFTSYLNASSFCRKMVYITKNRRKRNVILNK